LTVAGEEGDDSFACFSRSVCAEWFRHQNDDPDVFVPENRRKILTSEYFGKYLDYLHRHRSTGDIR